MIQRIGNADPTIIEDMKNTVAVISPCLLLPPLPEVLASALKQLQVSNRYSGPPIVVVVKLTRTIRM